MFCSLSSWLKEPIFHSALICLDNKGGGSLLKDLLYLRSFHPPAFHRHRSGDGCLCWKLTDNQCVGALLVAVVVDKMVVVVVVVFVAIVVLMMVVAVVIVVVLVVVIVAVIVVEMIVVVGKMTVLDYEWVQVSFRSTLHRCLQTFGSCVHQ